MNSKTENLILQLSKLSFSNELIMNADIAKH